ncbi:MAG: ATP-dependent DNA helicase [Deltaproteobacteria bacterium]|nr:ATP-dependent DNA helicase [Deltaproteobacteria bacterium]
MKRIKIAITDFAQPVVRSGSLSREGLMMGTELGADLHKNLQKQREADPAYKKEVPVKETFRTKHFKFEVSGRADGVYYGSSLMVEEIKSSFSLDRLEDDILADLSHPYRLQTLTYAYILQRGHSVPVKARLLLVSLRNRKEVLVPLEGGEAFESWLQQRLHQLERWERLKNAQVRKRKRLAGRLTFPFSSMRKHQDQLVETSAGVFEQGGSALLQAPTGIGKTMGILCPAIKEAFTRGAPVIYLTPKNSQFEVAKDAIERMEPKTRAIKTFVLTSKKKLCRKERVDCDPSYCEYAKDYYDKFEAHDLSNAVKRYKVFDQEQVLNLAELYKVCPYQVQMETIHNADLVVGDYNYVFSPRAALTGLFENSKKKERFNLIVDEVHNLYQRGMEYHSPVLNLSDLIAVSAAPVPLKLKAEFAKLTDKATQVLASYRSASGRSEVVEIDPDPFLVIQKSLHAFLIDYMTLKPELGDNDTILEFYLQWMQFVESLAVCGDETVAAFVSENGNEFLKLICCDPSRFLSETMGCFHATVGFSATLKPFDFYRKLSGFPDDTLVQEFSSGFPDENRKVLIIPQVSTTYRHRERNYVRIGEAVSRIALGEAGNYLVFFPSYHFLEQTEPYIESKEHQILVQRKDMTTSEVTQLAQRLAQQSPQVILLTVQGGVLSEGVDINTPHLKGAFVVGPAVPMVGFERELLRQYYTERFGNGFAYAYAYPAMTRSIQASGRVIRTGEKRGLIVLMDSRFLQPPYVETIPSFWFQNSPQELVSRHILEDVGKFWSSSS